MIAFERDLKKRKCGEALRFYIMDPKTKNIDYNVALGAAAWFLARIRRGERDGEHEGDKGNMMECSVGARTAGGGLATGAAAPAMVRTVLRRGWWPEWWGYGLGRSSGVRGTDSVGFLGWRRGGVGVHCGGELIALAARRGARA